MVSFLLGVLEQPELEQDETQTPFLSLQLYSEYRSTYKWHEFSSSPGARSSSATQQRNSTEVVVKKPPKPISGKQIKELALLVFIRQIALSSQILMATAFFLDFLTAAKDQEDVLVFLFPPPLF